MQHMSHTTKDNDEAAKGNQTEEEVVKLPSLGGANNHNICDDDLDDPTLKEQKIVDSKGAADIL